MVLIRRRGHDSRNDNGEEVIRSEEHTSELQSHSDLVCRLLLEKKKRNKQFNQCISVLLHKLVFCLMSTCIQFMVHHVELQINHYHQSISTAFQRMDTK